MRRSDHAGVHFIRRHFDEAAILAVCAKLAWDSDPHFSESELATIAAMHRAHPAAGDTPEALGEWLQGMSDEQVAGVVSNTKGVLHEMEFIRLENEDGDSVHAALFSETNHPSFDVWLTDTATGEHWEVQLKATDDPYYVQGWIDAHPDSDILITNELAEAMGVESSGFDNGELTARTEDVVDRLIQSADDDSIWDFVPALSVISIALVAVGLTQRYRKGEIDLEQLKWLLAKATGQKASKIALLALALTIPGLNLVTAALLAARLIHALATRLNHLPNRTLRQLAATSS